MVIKERISIPLTAVLGGAFFVWSSVGIMIGTETFHWLIALLTLFGSALSFFGVHRLVTRAQRAIIIDQEGITQMMGETEGRLPTESIQNIKKHASFSGRGVKITMVDGQEIVFDCRHYCTVKRFIALCRSVNLPCT